MTVHQLASTINDRAVSEGFKISQLPTLRKIYLKKKQLPSKLFTYKTIFDGEHQYFFHYGGRDEMQFNVGQEQVGSTLITRYALCFSLEASRSLPDPVNDLEPFRKRFNLCVEQHKEYFVEFEMWYHQNGSRSEHFDVRKISNDIFRLNTFICIGKTINKPLQQLDQRDITGILDGFDRLLPIYDFCVLQRIPLRIFTRLTSNDNKWEVPSPHKWKKGDQGKNNIPFENQYGFGHEEWLFNQTLNLNGFQYGFIRGIQNANDSISKYDEVFLYTVRKERQVNMVYYLGHIKDVWVIKALQHEQGMIQKVIDQIKPEMLTQIEAINGDPSGMIKLPFEAIVKFKLNDVHFFDEPVYQSDFNLKKFKRFQPYKLEGKVEEIFQLPKTEDGHFVAGKSSQTNSYSRKSQQSSVTIEKLHTEIVEALELYLKPHYSLETANISIEMTRFQGNIADIVTWNKDLTISIYEIKTSSSGRRNIRDAIAQLLDYALHSKDKVKMLVFVSPVKLTKKDQEFLEGLRSKINYRLTYYYYARELNPKFVEQ